MSPSWMSQLQLPILHRHDRTNRTGSACAHFACRSRTYGRAKVILRLSSQPTSRQQRLRYTSRWASLLLCLKCSIALVSPVAVASNHKAFLSTESGESALDACRNPMILGPQPATADFAENGYLLLAHASRVHLLTGSGAKVGCCLPKYGATSVESGLSGGHQRPSMSACRPAVRRPSVESVESMAMVHRYSTNTLRTNG